jgi:hypothetical protein
MPRIETRIASLLNRIPEGLGWKIILPRRIATAQ